MAAAIDVGVTNLACVNNSPLEYPPWSDERTMALVMRVEKVARSGVTCAYVLTSDKLDALRESLQAIGHDVTQFNLIWDAVKDLPALDVLANKKGIFATKRLASMPDRHTNKDRPAITTAVAVEDVDAWWGKQYLPYWFDGENAAIRRLKELDYDTLSPAEREASVSIQMLGIAVFDCALMHFARVASPDGELLRIKTALARNRADDIVKMVAGMLDENPARLLLIQEVDDTVRAQLAAAFPDHNHVYNAASGVQMSGIIAPPDWMPIKNVVSEILKHAKVPPAEIAAMVFATPTGARVMAVSIHADSDGTYSVSAVSAVVRVHSALYKDAELLIGIDSNAVAKAKKGKLSLEEFMTEAVQAHGLVSCHGDSPDPAVHYTSKKARSVLQTQLSKAVFASDGPIVYEQEVKLFLLAPFGAEMATVRRFSEEGRPCPNAQCPSDHFPIAVAVTRA